MRLTEHWRQKNRRYTLAGLREQASHSQNKEREGNRAHENYRYDVPAPQTQTVTDTLEVRS